METTADLVVPCPPAELFGHVSTLDRYPAWMGLVHAAEAVPGDDDRPAWQVELRTRVGPLARSKRLRMVRTEVVTDRRARFERHELDGRTHSPWVLVANVEPLDEGTSSRLEMHLAYGGSLWTGGILQRVLDEEIRRGSERLLAIVSGGTTR